MDVIELLKTDVKLSKAKRDDLMPNWQLNVNERRGKDFDSDADENRSRVPMDWTLTKTKAAQLFSQMPQVRMIPKHQSFEASVPIAVKIVNDLLTEADVEAVMGECVVDCVNAAGIGVALVRYESLSETLTLPAVDPTAIAMAGMGQAAPPVEDPANPIPTQPTTRVTDRRFCVDRVSPGDFLWPVSFRLSNWNKAPWLGHTGRGTWAQVSRLFPPDPTTGQRGLTSDDKDKVVGAAGRRQDQTLQVLQTDERKSEQEYVEYDEIFYWRHVYHEDEKYYDAIHHVVFVTGIDEPVIDKPWDGQQFDQQNGGYIGPCLLPIRVLTLNYISDEAIPPSDSAIIRPQVKELQESRQHMKDQRKHSRPLRGFNVDLVDAGIVGDLIKGTWQGMIPCIGNAERAIWEVARSAYPRENIEFDKILKQDIQEAVSVGPNQAGTFASGERSASEAKIVHQSFETEIAVQRARVTDFFVGITDVLFGLWARFGVVDPAQIGQEIGQDGQQRLASWDRAHINQKYIADVRADSTVRLDAQALVDQLTGILNVTAKSGFVNPKPLIKRIFEAAGVDPAEVLIDPKEKGPEPPKITYSFKGEDLSNPVVLAIIEKSGQGPTPVEIDAAKKLIVQMGTPPAPPPPPEVTGQPPMNASPPEHVTNPELPPEPHPNWESASRINTRRSEG